MPAPLQLKRALQSTCFNFGPTRHLARECPAIDQARKPVVSATHDDRVNYCEDIVASECTVRPVFCVNCGMTEHSASQCQNVAVHEDLAYTLWAEPPPTSHFTKDSELVLILWSAEAAHIATLLTITCEKIQVQVSPELIIFDPSGRTIMSIRLLLAIEQEQRPELTLVAN